MNETLYSYPNLDDTLKEREQIKTKMISIKLRTKEHGLGDKVHVSSVPTSNDLQKLNMY